MPTQQIHRVGKDALLLRLGGKIGREDGVRDRLHRPEGGHKGRDVWVVGADLRSGESGLDECAIDSSYAVNLDENVAISPLSTQHPITQLSLPGRSHTSHIPKVAASSHSKCCPQDSLALSSDKSSSHALSSLSHA